MAVRTLKAKYEAKDDSTSVVCRFEGEIEATSEPDAASETAPPAPSFHCQTCQS
ncbi:hypothetical protein BGW80DRAFT_1336087, partial [Lactifluus volemus]